LLDGRSPVASELLESSLISETGTWCSNCWQADFFAVCPPTETFSQSVCQPSVTILLAHQQLMSKVNNNTVALLLSSLHEGHYFFSVFLTCPFHPNEAMDNDEDYDNGAGAVWAGEEESDGYVKSIYDSLRDQTSTPPGRGWFIPDLATFHVPTAASNRFSCTPREYDQAPGDVPPDHPVRAVAGILAAAPELSIIRIYAYSLTDPYVIGMIAHHAKSKVIQIILHPDLHSIRRIKEFCANIPTAAGGSNPQRVLSSRVEIRVFQLDGPHCNEFSAMHGKSIITDSLLLVGSYNLSVQARCKNKELVYVIETTDENKTMFDNEWKSL
jgi:hypothetical protein